MAYSFNPFTGNLDLTNTATVTGPSYNVQPYTLTPTDEANKYVLLPSSPTDDASTTLEIIGGSPQFYGTDFEITHPSAGVSRLSWLGKVLDGVLSSGDLINVIYN